MASSELASGQELPVASPSPCIHRFIRSSPDPTPRASCLYIKEFISLNRSRRGLGAIVGPLPSSGNSPSRKGGSGAMRECFLPTRMQRASRGVSCCRRSVSSGSKSMLSAERSGRSKGRDGSAGRLSWIFEICSKKRRTSSRSSCCCRVNSSVSARDWLSFMSVMGANKLFER